MALQSLDWHQRASQVVSPFFDQRHAREQLSLYFSSSSLQWGALARGVHELVVRQSVRRSQPVSQSLGASASRVLFVACLGDNSEKMPTEWVDGQPVSQSSMGVSVRWLGVKGLLAKKTVVRGSGSGGSRHHTTPPHYNITLLQHRRDATAKSPHSATQTSF